MSAPTLREHLRERPYHLALSSGFFGFFAHAGVLLELCDAGLAPASLSGASAGALVAGTYAAGVDPDAVARELLSLRRADFWDPALGLGLLRGRLFRERLAALLPVPKFEDARVPVSLSVFDVLRRRTHALILGELAPAICASCAVPGMFHPVWIHGRPYLDGGVGDRSALQGVDDQLPILLHHLPSSSGLKSRSQIPERDNLSALVINGLPSVGPFKLHAGERAFDRARKATKLALNRPIVRRLIQV